MIEYIHIQNRFEKLRKLSNTIHMLEKIAARDEVYKKNPYKHNMQKGLIMFQYINL